MTDEGNSCYCLPMINSVRTDPIEVRQDYTWKT